MGGHDEGRGGGEIKKGERRMNSNLSSGSRAERGLRGHVYMCT